MDQLLQNETMRLARSWTRHEAAWLRDYLVAEVEDPRINLQSIFTRHFILWATVGDAYSSLMEEEYRFSAVMNWLLHAAKTSDDTGLAALLHALRQGADNAEGTPIPAFVLNSFRRLPAKCLEAEIPNYVEWFLETRMDQGKIIPPLRAFDVMANLWQEVLGARPATSPLPRLLEPACGSANDYRFLVRYGLDRLVDYAGFDLCPANIENARALFPDARFSEGNVFEIQAETGAFDLCVVHDLLEHLSPEGLAAAVAELTRVTRRKLCVHFFQMAEIPEHIIRPVEDYHWNTLSLERMRTLFAGHGFEGQILSAEGFLRHKTGCAATHNPNAYTFLLEPRRDASERLDSSP